MDLKLKEAQTVIELFRAHFTISEIVERTGLKIETVVKVLNAPRIVNRESEETEKMAEQQVA